MSPTDETHPRARVTIREIADLAGVSVATVSRVMNGRDDVAPETRELVQRIVREHGYTTNRTARGLSAGRTGLIGATVPLVHPAYFSFILSGAAGAPYRRHTRPRRSTSATCGSCSARPSTSTTARSRCSSG